MKKILSVAACCLIAVIILLSLSSCWLNDKVETLEFDVTSVEAPSYDGGTSYGRLEIHLNSSDFGSYVYYEDKDASTVFQPKDYFTLDANKIDLWAQGLLSQSNDGINDGMYVSYQNTLDQGIQQTITFNTDKWFYRYTSGGELMGGEYVAKCRIKTPSHAINYVKK